MLKISRGFVQATVRILGGLAILGTATGARRRMPVYTLTDLGDLDGASSEANAINDLGQVVGGAATATGEIHAFFHDGAMSNLGTLEGGTSSRAVAVNVWGDVVGSGGINRYGPQFPQIMQAFIWQDGTMRSLGALYCPCTYNRRYGYSEAHGINSSGQVVGFSETIRCGSQHAFLWQDGLMEDISGGAGDPSYSRAYAINDAGQVTGFIIRDYCFVRGAPARAFLWDDGVLQELGVLFGDTFSVGYGINEAGQVVGWSGDGSVNRAVLWDHGPMTDLGLLAGQTSSSALAVNDAGQVVGLSWGNDASSSRAFLWQAGIMYDLNELLAGHPNWVLLEATGINNAGEVVGFGLRNGRVRAYLLTPRGTPGTTVKPPRL